MEIKINLDFEKWEKDISEVKSKVLNKVSDITKKVKDYTSKDVYVHYKNNKEYQILDNEVKLKENNEWVEGILYQNKEGNRYVRTREDFFEKFSIKED